MDQGRTQIPDTWQPRSLAWPLLSLIACALLWPALLTFDMGDWPSPHQFPHNDPTANACGFVGAACAYALLHYLGDGAYPFLLFLTLAALIRLVRGTMGRLTDRALGLALVVACTSSASHLIGSPELAAMPVGHGGILGFALGEWLTVHLSRVGTLIVLSSAFLVGLIFVTEGWILTLPALAKRFGRASIFAAGAARQATTTAVAGIKLAMAGEGVSQGERSALLDDGTRRASSGRPSASVVQRPRSSKPAAGTLSETWPDDEEDDEEILESFSSAPQTTPVLDDMTASIPRSSTAHARQKPKSDPEEDACPNTSELSLAPPQRPRGRPIVKFPSAARAAAAEPYPRKIENWTLPDLSLLDEPEYGFNAQQEVIVREQARVLEQTLEEFRIEARVVEIDTGPVITMFEIKLGAGIKVSQIAVLSNDIARALKAHAIRVVAPISGKNTVGIEVPNQCKEKVRLKELIQLAGKRASEMSLPLFLGKDAAGQALVANLTKMPHLLIAGTTGSGKSVCLNAVVLSFLMTQRPDRVKLIMIDPKMVELSQFKDVPHLMCPIVTDMVQAEQILEWAVTKMEERYELLAEARVKNIAGYNALGAEKLFERLSPATEQEKARIVTYLPYIVIIIDELADLMMTAAKEVEHHLSRLAQKSRAVGIHIIVATQRPEARVVTGLIKSNLPSRICFRVSSRTDSRIVLDQNGGEVLLGQGDMLFLPPGAHKLIRAQGTYLEDSEVQAVLDDLASRAKPEFHPELLSLRSRGSADDELLRDPLFDEAVCIVLESKRGSVSLLQRRLTIGYSRASRLIEQMAAAGIVGDYKGSQAREVLMTPAEWEALREQLQADLAQGYEADGEGDDDHLSSSVLSSNSSPLPR